MYQIQNRSGLSLFLILIIGSLLSGAILVVILLFGKITTGYSPSLKQSEKLLKEGKYKESLAVAARTATNGVNSYRYHLVLGKIWSALAWERQNVDQWRSYGTIPGNWLSGPESDSALTHLLKAIELRSDEFEAHRLLGVLYLMDGLLSQAQQELETALELNEHDTESMLALGSLFTRINRIDDAEQMLRKAFIIDPENPAIAKNMGYLFRFYKEKPESAVVWFNRYLNLFPERDPDINIVHKEIEEILSRYPEYAPAEPQKWREQKKKFVGRK